MSFREAINSNPKRTTIIAAGFVVLAVIILILTSRGGPGLTPKTEAFFTSDDGQSFFKAPLTNIPPFDHEGQPAVRAYVFKAGDKQFVGYMEKFTPEGKRKVEQFLSQNPQVQAKPSIYRTEVELAEILVKRPGDKDWVPASNEPRLVEITTVKTPDGQPALAVQP